MLVAVISGPHIPKVKIIEKSMGNTFTSRRDKSIGTLLKTTNGNIN